MSFVKLPGKAVKQIAIASLSLPICQSSNETPSKPTPLTTQLRSLELCRVHDTPLAVSFCCQRLPSINLCQKTPNICHSLVPRCANRNSKNHLARCWSPGLLQQSTYHRSFSFANQYVIRDWMLIFFGILFMFLSIFLDHWILTHC